MSIEHLLADARDPEESVSVPAITELAREMKDIKEALDDMEAKRKSLQARYDEIRKRELPDALATAGLANIRLDTGELFSPRQEVYANVLAANRPAFHFWMRDNGHGSLIQESINPQTLKAWAREQVENGRELPPQLTITKEPVIVMTKGKSK